MLTVREKSEKPDVKFDGIHELHHTFTCTGSMSYSQNRTCQNLHIYMQQRNDENMSSSTAGGSLFGGFVMSLHRTSG